MTKEERMLVRVVCEEAYTNEDEKTYEVYRTLDDCYSSYSDAKRRAYCMCESRFSEDVRYFENLRQTSFFTFSRILSYNTMMFTLLQCAYYFTKNGSLIAVLRYDTPVRTLIRGFKMSKDGIIDFRKSAFDVEELIRVNN